MDPKYGDQSHVVRKRAGRYYLKLAYATLVDVTWLRFSYFVVTLITCAQAMFRSSFAAGAGALGAAALCYFSIATFVGSYHARREQSYSPKDLAGIGAIAAVLCGAGFALMLWSGWRITIYALVIPGFVWTVVGIVIAIVSTTKKDALGTEPARRSQPRQAQTSNGLSAGEAEKIIHDYVAAFANVRGIATDSSKLPHPKERIKQALALALKRTSEANMRSQLRDVYLSLADWHPGVGDSLAAFAITKPDITGDIRVAAERISQAGPAFQKWLSISEAERKQLQTELDSVGA